MTNAKVHEGFRVDKKVEEHCLRYKQLLSKATPYVGEWWYKQLLYKSTPYAGGAKSCI